MAPPTSAAPGGNYGILLVGFVRRPKLVFSPDLLRSIDHIDASQQKRSMELCTSLSEMVKDKLFNLDNVVCKNNKEAFALKINGNSAFQANNWTLALGIYNEALMMTPTENVKDFAILLANRSAVLYHMKQYKLAIKDIEMAAINYPKDKMYKIKERLAKCYLSTGDFHNSLNAFKQMIRCLNESSLHNDKRITSENEAQIMIKNLEDKLKQINRASNQLSIKKYADDDMKTKLNDSVGFDYNASKGRYAKAKSDIKVGESILIEKPHCAVLYEEYSKTHCHHCFLRTIAPIVCPNCPNVIFCSNECKDLALSSYHEIECKFLSFIWSSGLSITCQMAFKIIAQKPLQYFINIKDQLNDKLKFHDTLRLSPDDYRTVFTLIRHENNCTLFDLTQYSVTANCLTYFLRKGNYFSSINTNDKQFNELNSFIQGLFFRNLQFIRYNTHTVNEIEGFECEENQKINSIGIGIYPTFARFNHSCNPSVMRYFKGTSVYVHAITNIKKGEVIADNYGPIFIQDPYDDRQEKLQEYAFNCMCKPCSELWPLYNDLDETKIPFKCAGGKPKCKNILMISFDVHHDYIKCNKCNKITNIIKCFAVIQELNTLKTTAERFFECGQNQKAAEIYCEMITIMDEFTGLPFIEYLNAQQSYRDCLLLNGNKNVLVKNN